MPADVGRADAGTDATSTPRPDFGRDVHCLFGLPFDAVTLDAAVERIRTAAAARRRCFVSTPNLNFVVGCLDDAAFRGSVLRSDLSLADGMPLIWAARVLRVPIRQRVAGSTLFDRLRDPAASIGGRPWRVFFFGGPEGSAATADAVLGREGGGAVGVGSHPAGFGSIEDMSAPAVIDAINASEADFLLVALGAKKGQRWIEHNLPRLTVPVVSHLGAVVNFVAGRMRRAPTGWQRFGMEWLWRIREEPALWRRYLADGWVLARLVATRVLPLALSLRLERDDAADALPASVAVVAAAGRTIVRPRGAWTGGDLAPLRDAFAAATRDPGAIDVDAAGLGRLDSASIGLLLILAGHQSRIGQPFAIVEASPRLRRRLRRWGADHLLDSGEPGRA